LPGDGVTKTELESRRNIRSRQLETALSRTGAQLARPEDFL
jgi:hypothetical protein